MDELLRNPCVRASSVAAFSTQTASFQFPHSRLGVDSGNVDTVRSTVSVREREGQRDLD